MDAIEVIRILQSKYVFYVVMGLIFSFSWLYHKMVKGLKFDLGIEEDMTSYETWEMVKEENEKGNVKARIAFWACAISSACGLLLGGLICLLNVDV